MTNFWVSWIWKWYSVVLRYDLHFKCHQDIFTWHNSPLHTKSLYYWKGFPFFSYNKESKIQAITTSLDHRIVVVQWDLSRSNKSVVDGMVAFTSRTISGPAVFEQGPICLKEKQKPLDSGLSEGTVLVYHILICLCHNGITPRTLRDKSMCTSS